MLTGVWERWRKRSVLQSPPPQQQNSRNRRILCSRLYVMCFVQTHFRLHLSLDSPRHFLKFFGVDRDSTFDGRAPPAYSCWPAGPRGVSAESSPRTAAWQIGRGGTRLHQARSPTRLAGLRVAFCLRSCPRRARTRWILEGVKPAPASSPHRHGCGVSGTPPSKDAPVLSHARECRRQGTALRGPRTAWGPERRARRRRRGRPKSACAPA